jgi:hypothetical protein
VSSKKYREATEATQPGWFSLLFLSENHPGLAMRMLRGIFLIARPPLLAVMQGVHYVEKKAQSRDWLWINKSQI